MFSGWRVRKLFTSCNTLFAQHSEKSNLRHIENQTSYSTLPAFIFVHNSRGRYGEATIKNELTLYVMLDSYWMEITIHFCSSSIWSTQLNTIGKWECNGKITRNHSNLCYRIDWFSIDWRYFLYLYLSLWHTQYHFHFNEMNEEFANLPLSQCKISLLFSRSIIYCMSI